MSIRTEQQPIHVIVHGYAPEHPTADNPRMDQQGRLVVRAVSELWNQRETKGTDYLFIFPTAAGNPSIAQTMVDELHQINPTIPETATVVVPTAATTIGEIEQGKKITDLTGAKKVVSLGAAHHLARIRHDLTREYQGAGSKTESLSAEGILLRSPNAKAYLPEIMVWHRSPEAEAFADRDKKLLALDRLPYGKQLLKGINVLLKGNKGPEIFAGKLIKHLKRKS